jgi:hypothetical protein
MQINIPTTQRNVKRRLNTMTNTLGLRSVGLRVFMQELYFMWFVYPGAPLRGLYDPEAHSVKFEITANDTTYDEWQAGDIDACLGPLRYCAMTYRLPKEIRLVADCYEWDGIGRGCHRVEWYTPRSLEWMLYVVEGFKKREVTLCLMSPSLDQDYDSDLSDEFEWSFYVAFADSLAAELVFYHGVDYTCSYKHIIRRW